MLTEQLAGGRDSCSSVASRSDITLFTLFAYFTVCRLKDLGFKPYRYAFVATTRVCATLRFARVGWG